MATKGIKRNQLHRQFPSSSPFRTPMKTPRKPVSRSTSARGAGGFLSPPPTAVTPSLLLSPPRMSASTTKRKSSRATTTTPGSSAAGEDRFIPNRRRMNFEICRRRLLADEDDVNVVSTTTSPTSPTAARHESKTGQNRLKMEYKKQMLSSLCDVPLDTLDENAQPKSLQRFGEGKETNNKSAVFDPNSLDHLHVLQRLTESSGGDGGSGTANSSTMHGGLPHGLKRKLPETARRIFGVPGLVKDFYINHLSWNNNNILAVIADDTVFLWNETTKIVDQLTSLDENVVLFENVRDCYTSVQWCNSSRYLVLGTDFGIVEVWDPETKQLLRKFYGHDGRVAALAWNNGHWLSTGGQDGLIFQRDTRTRYQSIATYVGHQKEVVRMKWNEDNGTTLASGGNDDMVCIWDAAMASSVRNPFARFSRDGPSNVSCGPRLALQDHTAAIKAIDWCPHRRGLLATGGGTEDQCIKLWNSTNGQLLNSVDTKSQVCDLVWSKDQMELCSGHGFSKKSLILWKYNRSHHQLTKIKEFPGHDARIFSLALSPNGETVVAACGDETLCFWDIFGDPTDSWRRQQQRLRVSAMMPLGELTLGTIR